MTTTRTPADRTRYPNQQRPWSAHEEQEVVALIQAGRSWPQIERAIGRNTTSIVMHFQVTGRSVRELRRAAGGCRAVYEVGQLIGIGTNIAYRWVETGAMKATRSTRGARFRYVADDDLMVTLENRMYWMDWTPAAITDPDWREWARGVHNQGGRWLQRDDLCAMYHASVGTVSNWLWQGIVPGRHKHQGRYYIWSAALDTFTPPLEAFDSAARTAANRRAWVTRRQRQEELTHV